MKNLLIVPLIIFAFISSGQERCSTEEYQKILENKYPEYSKARKNVNYETEQWIQNNSNYKYGSIITVPVVVHVVWNTNAENISDAQINSQITILNNDFRRTNADAINTPSVWSSVAADTEIEFCLASIDPQGNSTTGITRTQTSLTSF